jgi:hypothetical protein
VYEAVDTTSSPTATAVTWCPGRCNAAFRAAERRYDSTGTDHDIQPWDGQPVWCPPCTTSIRAAVAEWPGLAARLVEEIDSGVSARLGEYVSGSKNQPVHDHENASFLLDEFAEWIGQWEATIRVERRLARRKAAGDPCTAIANACGFLLPHLDWQLRERDDVYDLPPAQIATDFGAQLLGFHRRAQIATGTQDAEPVRVVGVPCPMCDHKALEHEVETEAGRRQRVTRFQYDEDGEVRNHLRPQPDKLTEGALAPMQGAVTGYIRCRRCRPAFRMSPEEYATWTRLLAASARTRALATREKLAEIFGNSVPTQYKAKP